MCFWTQNGLYGQNMQTSVFVNSRWCFTNKQGPIFLSIEYILTPKTITGIAEILSNIKHLMLDYLLYLDSCNSGVTIAAQGRLRMLTFM